MKNLKSVYRCVLVGAVVILSGCHMVPGLIAHQAMSYGAMKAIQVGSSEKPPKSLQLSERSGIIKVVIEVKQGLLHKGGGKASHWAKAATVIKAEQLGCVKTKSIPYSDAQVGTPSLLGGFGSTSITNTILSKCLYDQNDPSGEGLADQKVVYEQYITALKRDNLITYIN